MASVEFNAKADDQTILIDEIFSIDERLDEVQSVLEQWGFEVLEDKRDCFGRDGSTYRYLGVKLPEGWRKEEEHGRFTHLFDDDDARRISILHDYGEVYTADLPTYRVDICARFELKDDYDEDRICYLVDHKTGEKLFISDKNSDPRISPMLSSGILRTVLCKRYDIPYRAGYQVSNACLYPLWDRDIDLSESDVSEIAQAINAEAAGLDHNHALKGNGYP